MKKFQTYTTYIVCSLIALVLMSSVVMAVENTFQVSLNVATGADVTAPSIPAGLSASAISDSEIDLSWNASTDDIAVDGYRIFRDGAVIATTTALSYSDSGLSEDTLYSYTVEAFDTSFNYSGQSTAATATTEVTPTNTPGGNSSGTVQHVIINGLNASADERSAVISFATNVPTFARVYWGLTADYELGSIAGLIYNKDHQIKITGLEKGTRYFLKVEATSASSRSAFVETTFATIAEVPVSPLPNPTNFKATTQDQAINLSWTNPNDPRFDSVRIVRSEKFFPYDSQDGEVIYEGSAEQFVDADVKVGKTYYYALFARGIDGTYSSGALAQGAIARPGEIITVPLDPFANLPQAENVHPVIKNLTLADFDFIQDGNVLSQFDNLIAIDGSKNLSVRLSYDKVPEILKTIAFTIADPSDPAKVFPFLLRVNEDKTAYEATIGALGRSGNYGMSIAILDYKNQGMKRLSGELQAIAFSAPDIAAGVSSDFFGLFLLLIVLILISTFVVRLRSKKQTAAIALSVIALFILQTLPFVSGISFAQAAFNQNINYQGKLADDANSTVADGTYEMEFKLYTAATGGTAIWTETLDGADEVQVTSGLFSVMLGSTTPFTGVDFNQTLYLGVNIEGDGEMSPRKVLGAVPAAFYAATSSVALSANTLEGYNSDQFLRADAENATSTSSTFLSIAQFGAGKIAEFFGAASQSVLSILSNGNVGIGTSTPTQKLEVNGNILVNKGTTNRTAYLSDDGLYISRTSDGTYPSSIVANGSMTFSTRNNYIFNGAAGAEYFRIESDTGNVGIGDATPDGKLEVRQTGTSDILNLYDNTTNVFTVVDGGNVGIGSSSPSKKLTVSGGDVYIDGANNSILTINKLGTGHNALLQFSQGGTNYASLSYNSSGNFVLSGPNSATTQISAANSADLHLSAGASSYMRFTTNNIEAARITSAGNFGIGTTSPFAKLSVAGNAYIGGNLTATGTVTIASLTGPLQAVNGLVSASSTISTFYGGTGISTAPTYGQLLLGNATGGYTLTATSSLGLGSGTVDSGTAGQFPYYAANGTTLSATSTLFVATNGNVGVGSTTPSSKLSVNGNAALTGTIGVNGQVPNSNYGISYKTSQTVGYFYNNAGVYNDITSLAKPSGPPPFAGGVQTGVFNSITTTSGTYPGVAYGTYTLSNSNSTGGTQYAYYADSVPGTATKYGFYSTGENYNYFSGNVGIGTTSPFAKLSVVGNTYIGGNLTATGTVQFTGLSSGALAADANGTLYSFSTSTLTAASSTLLADNNTFSGQNTFSGATTTFTGGLSVASPNWYTGFTVLENGYVGISQSSPLHELDVAGGVLVADANNGRVGLGVEAGTSWGSEELVISNWWAGSGGPMIAFVNDNFADVYKIGSLNSNAFAITDESNNEFLTIPSSGNVGIGTTSPYAKLSVAGQTVAEYFTATSTTATSTFAGAVGIGTASPTQKLDVAGNINVSNGSSVGLTSNAAIKFTNSNTFEFLFSGVNRAQIGSSYVGLNSSGSFGWTSTGNGGSSFDTSITRQSAGVIGTAGIYASGSVGIGTTSPLAKLSVAGDTYLGGNLTATGTLTVSGTGTSTFAGGVGIGTVSPKGTGQRVVEIAGVGGGANQFGSLSLSNASDSGSVYTGSIDSYGSNTQYSAIKTKITSGGPSGDAQIEFWALDDGTLKNTFSINGTGDLSIGASNGTSNGTLSIYKSTSGSTASNLTLANNQTPVGSNSSILFSSIDQNGTSAEVGRIVGAKTERTNDYVSGDLVFQTTYQALTTTERMRLTGAGNLGIGTTSPFATLSVNAAAGVNSFAIGSSTGTHFAVNSNGGVGVGGTAETMAASTFDFSAGDLFVGADLGVEGNIFTDTGYYVGGNAIINSTANFTNLGGQIRAGSGNGLNFQTDASGTTHMTVTTAGLVGIGTTTPFAKLSVGGAAYIGGNLTATGTLTVSGTGTSTFANGIDIASGCFAVAGTCIGASGSGSGTVNSGTTGYLPYYAANGTTLTATSSIFLASNGNVGVGTTSPFAALSVLGKTPSGTTGTSASPVLAVYGGAGAAGAGAFVSGGVGAPIILKSGFGGYSASGAGGAGGAISIISDNGGGTDNSFPGGAGGAISILTGNGGMGGNDYGNGGSFSVITGNGAVGGNIALTSGNGDGLGTTGGSISLTAGDGGTNGTDGNVTINPGTGVGNGNILLATVSGNVGIGTTSPFAKLSVGGNAYIGGNLTATGTLSVSGATTLAGLTASSLTLGSLTGPLQAVNGLVSASSTISTFYGGTGISTAPTYGQLLLGNALGGYTLTATSSLGLGSGTVGSGTTGQFPYYAANGTTLTATSSLFLATSGNVGIGTTSPFARFSIGPAANFTNKPYALAVYGTYNSTTGEGVLLQAGRGGSKGGSVTIAAGASDAAANGGDINLYSGQSGTAAVSGSINIVAADSATPSIFGGTAGSVNILAGRNLGGGGGASGNINIGVSTGGYILLATSTGNVGIGTTSPFAKLSVAGAAYIGGNITATGTLNVSGAVTALSGLSVLNTLGDTTLSINNYSDSSLTSSNGLINIGDESIDQEMRFVTNGGGVGASISTTNSYFAASSGSVGIGTTSPFAKLSVTGDTYVAGNLIATGTATFGSGNQAINITTGSISSDNMFQITSTAGYIGYGAESSVSWPHEFTGIASFNNGINLESSLYAGGSAGTSGYVLQSQGDGTNPVWVATSSLGITGGGGSGSGTVNSGTTGQFAYYAANGTAVSATSSIFLAGNGNVGIGTDSPTFKIDVAGDGEELGMMRITDTFNSSSLTFGVSGANGTSDMSLWSNNGRITIGDGASDAVLRLVNDVGTLTTSISSNGYTHFNGGNVGIGSTSPFAKLSVTGSGTGTGMAFQVADSSNSPKFSVLDNGNVGIGVSSPESLLHLSSDYPELLLNNTSVDIFKGRLGMSNDGAVSLSGNLASDESIDDSSWAAWKQSIDVANDKFSVKRAGIGSLWGTNVELLTIKGTTGNVGIGTSSPYAKLSVAGQVVADYFHATSTTATSTFAGGLYASGMSVFDNVQLGALNFETNAGMVNWINLPVTSAAANGTVQSYSASIGDVSILTVYSESDGAGGVKNMRVGIGTTSPYATLAVAGNVVASNFIATSTATSTFAGNLSVGDESLGDAAMQLGTDPFAWSLGYKQSDNSFRISSSTALGTNDVFTIQKTGGKVGIGTSSPASTLTVSGSACFSQGAGSASIACGTTAGNIYYTTANTGNYDVAENYATRDATLSAGDIVSLDPANPLHIVKAKNNQRVIGIVSTDPGLKLGGADPAAQNSLTRPIALSGRVPVKISLEGGPIAIGDPIALSSVSGVGRKATESGDIIGVALESFNDQTGTSTNTIQVFVNLRQHIDLSTFALATDAQSATTTTLFMALQALSEKVDGMNSKLTQLMSANISYNAEEIASTTAANLATSTSFIGSIATSVKEMISSTGEWIVQKISATLAIFDRVETQTAAVTKGLEMTDQTTGKVYCVIINEGEWDKREGSCSSLELEDLEVEDEDSEDPVVEPESDPTPDPVIEVSDDGTETASTTASNDTTETTDPEPVIDPAPEIGTPDSTVTEESADQTVTDSVNPEVSDTTESQESEEQVEEVEENVEEEAAPEEETEGEAEESSEPAESEDDTAADSSESITE